MSIIAAMVLLVSGTSLVDMQNPIAPSAHGQLQCYEPNAERRTCRSLAAYELREDGSYINTAVVLVSTAGPVTMETISLVTLKGGAVCGTLRAEDISRGKLRFGDRKLPDSEAAPVLGRIAQAMGPILDKEICTSYVPSADGFIAKATVAGEYRPDGDQRVKWVRPDDGYRVAP